MPTIAIVGRFLILRVMIFVCIHNGKGCSIGSYSVDPLCSWEDFQTCTHSYHQVDVACWYPLIHCVGRISSELFAEPNHAWAQQVGAFSRTAGKVG